MKEEQKIIRMQSTQRSLYGGYTSDNIARRESVLPQYEQEDEKERIRRERHKRWERSVRKHAVEKDVKERLTRANTFSLTEAVIVSLLSTALLGACVFFVTQEANLSQAIKQQNALQAEYEALLDENDLLYSKVHNSIDVDEIYRRAVDEFEMTYPTKAQVVEYTKPENSRVYQRESIPEN